MIKKIFFLTIFVFSISLESQTRGFEERYFAKHNVELLKGKVLQVLEIPDYLQKFGYKGFYNSEEFDYKNIYKCKKTKCFRTEYEDLVNKEFTVLDYQQYENVLRERKYKLKLLDANNEILFFDYDPESYTNFPFKIVDFNGFPDEFYCNQIVAESDRFDGSIKKYSPVSENVMFVKVGKDIYLNLRTIGATPVVNSKGVVILLSNKQKINKPNEKVDVKVNSSGEYEYSSFILLTKTDIDLLSKFDILDFKLYIFENAYNLYGEKYRRFLKCIK